jgi:hypothetical protein
MTHPVSRSPFVPSDPRNDEDDGDWQREFAMQAGMGLGIAAYNEAMGYDCEPMPYDDDPVEDQYDREYAFEDAAQAASVALSAEGIQWPTADSDLNEDTGLPAIAWFEDQVPWPLGQTLARMAELAARYDDEPTRRNESELRAAIASVRFFGEGC